MNIIERAKIARAITLQILHKGLYNSTFKEMHPNAYKELVRYEEDIEEDVMKVLSQKRWKI